MAALACASLSACALGGPDDYGRTQFPLSAFCQGDVGGALLDIETDYLPHVINCENGGADFEALKAQAVAARSYLYYSLEHYGMIGDGTGSQVYSCGREPQAIHMQAVEETSGQVLRYRDTQVAAFFVAGALQDSPGCTGGGSDPTGTEAFVTYNEGRSGDNIEQTSLGWMDPSNYANRGCLSQNGSDCLSLNGRTYDSILRFYYGEDIDVVQAEGPCVIPSDTPQTDAGPAASGVDGGPGGPAQGGDDRGGFEDPDQKPPDLVGGCSAAPGAPRGGLLFALFFGLALLRRRR